LGITSYMNYWLVKADPDTDYSIDDLEKDGSTIWDGVHNFQAINNIKMMKPGDFVYIYHSQKQKSIVGLAKVNDEPFENLKDPRKSWAVELEFVKKFERPLSLGDIKAEKDLQDFLLVRHTRLSVMPAESKHQKIIEALLS
jgi:predicted RNA-binding protein with PUA-like domain